jgi:hypothetical protein
VTLTAEFLSSLGDIRREEWNRVACQDYPFLRHEFLYGLEKTECTTAETGWQPCHLLLREGDDLQAVMPLYLKSHSYGEYVFDWSWADAWRRSGLEYYPKLLSAIPFTPATGPRLCVRDGVDATRTWPLVTDALAQLAVKQDISSWHLLFPEEAVSEKLLELGTHRRTATQFHWFNEGYRDFDDFLSTFSSRKRKNLRRERARVAEQGLELQTLAGSDISEGDWLQFYRFYQMTYAKRSGHAGYLTRNFFLETAPSLGEQVVMVIARLSGDAVAAALYFRSNDTLYGRYWGCEREFDCLHFEACYYQGIDYCIETGKRVFEPGTQGEHKISRGFAPTTTWSAHWLAHPEFASAIERYLDEEGRYVDRYMDAVGERTPFRTEPEDS